MSTVIIILIACLGWGILVARDIRGLDRARRRRQAQLEQHPALGEEEWVSRYLPQAGEHLPAILEVCRALGKHMNVDWTRLRPDDTFTGTYSVKPSSIDDEEMFELELFMENWVEKYDLKTLHGVMPDRLGDYLSKLITLLEQHRG
jgi:hypothetical protein